MKLLKASDIPAKVAATSSPTSRPSIDKLVLFALALSKRGSALMIVAWILGAVAEWLDRLG